MIQKYWQLLNIWQFKALEQISAQSDNSSYSIFASQCIQQGNRASLAETSNKYSFIQISLRFLLFPVFNLIFNLFIQNLQALFNLAQTASFIFILCLASKGQSFNIIPTWAFLATVDSNRSKRRMKQLNTGPFKKRRIWMTKEIVESCRRVAKPMKPNECKQGFLGVEDNCFISLIQDLVQ